MMIRVGNNTTTSSRRFSFFYGNGGSTNEKGEKRSKNEAKREANEGPAALLTSLAYSVNDGSIDGYDGYGSVGGAAAGKGLDT